MIADQLLASLAANRPYSGVAWFLDLQMFTQSVSSSRRTGRLNAGSSVFLLQLLARDHRVRVVLVQM